MIGDRLSIFRKLSYGVGHVLNDLCASMWFSYFIIYFHRIVNFDNSLAGYLLLLGQVADAISTTFVGFESDRTQSGFFNYGRRKSWHLVGCLSVLLSFPFIYNLCPGCVNSPNWAKFIYYAPFVIIFQFGWASTQISHLSLIPQLTPCENERVALNSIRYAFTVMSNIFVYGCTYLLLKFKCDCDSSKSDNDQHLTPADAPKFTILVIIVCAVGLLFQVIFHLGTRESNDNQEEPSNERRRSFVMQESLNWKGYLKSAWFYKIAAIYMSTRLIVNVTQVYFPMYLTDTISLNKTFIALVPLITYVSGFVTSLCMRYINKYVGRNVSYLIGLVLIALFSLLMWFDSFIYSCTVNSLVAAVLLGAAGSIILITSLSMTTDLIGDNTNTGAFVYGAMSFTDKLSNGIVIAILQQINPCDVNIIQCSCKEYYRYIMAFLPSGCAIIALIFVLELMIRKRRNGGQSSLILNEEDDETRPILVH